MNIKKVKKRYRNEWVLVEVLEEDELNRPINVRLIAHSKNRDDTYKAMKKTKSKYTYHFYTGKIPKKGYAVAFHGEDALSCLHFAHLCHKNFYKEVHKLLIFG